MKVINLELSKDIKELRIIPISDCHLGDGMCDMKYLKSVIERAKNEKDTYLICNGDICNTAIVGSKSDTYAENLTPMQEMEMAVNLLKDVKDKILVYSSGNHEKRIYKVAGIDIAQLTAEKLGIGDRYADGMWYLFLRFGQKKDGRKAPMNYQICGIHGYGGGRKTGSKANNLVDFTNIAVADLYIFSHTHLPLSTKKSVFIPDYANGTLNKKQQYLLMTNSFLKYGGYGEQLGYMPNDNTITEAVLDGTQRKIKTIL